MQLEMIPDLQPDFMSYLGIHKLGHLIMIKNLADELLSRLSPLPPSIISYPSSDFESCHSNIASVNTNLSPAFNSEVILDPHEFEALLPSNSLDISTSIQIEPTPDTELQLLPLFSTPNTSRNAATTRDGLTSKVKAANKCSRTKRQTLISITNEIQSNPNISISNTPHDSLTNISDGIDHAPSHSPDISSPGVFVFHTKTTRPVISRFHPSGTDTQLRSEIDEYTSPVKSGLVLSANKIDNSQITPVRNQLTSIMSSPLNSQVHNPTDFIPVLHTSQDTSITITSTNLANVDVPDIRPAELSSPSPATRLNSIQQPTNSPCVTAMSPVHNTSKRKKKPATTKRKTSKRLRPKSPPIVVHQFDPWLFDELLPPPLSPQTEELAVSQQSDFSTSNTLHVHDSEAGIVTTADSILDTRPRMISVSLTELNSYEQYPISGTVKRDLSENTQGYLAKFATELGELPNFFDQEKIKPSPQKKTRLRKKNKTKTQDVKLSPTKSRKLHNKKTRIVRTNKLIRPTKMKTKVTLKKKQLIRQMTNLSFDTGRRSTSPENSETDLDRRIEHSLSIVKKKYYNFYSTIYPELQSQDNVIQLPTQRQRDYVTPSQGVQMSLKDTLIHARQERRNFACHKCLLCFETPYQLLQHSMLRSCDEITSSYPEY